MDTRTGPRWLRLPSSSLRTPTASQALKWLGFVTAVWVQSISGNNYTFANYSDAVKTLMGLTQSELNGLSVAKDIGKAFGILAGLAADAFPTPVILLIGSLEGLVGYGAQWLVVSGTIRPLAYWQMCVFLCMGGNSTTWMNTAVLVTCIRNFRRNRGPVSGILKGYVGLSTAIFTDLCSALFSDSPSSFLVMLAVIPGVVCLAAMLFLREIPDEGEGEAEAAAAGSKDGHPPVLRVQEEEQTDYFPVFNVVAVIIAFYLLAYDLFGKRYGSTGVVSTTFAVGLLALLAAPLGIPLRIILGKRKKNTLEEDADADADAAVTAPLLGNGNGVVPTAQEVVEVVDASAAVVVNGNNNNNISSTDGSCTKKAVELGDEHTIREVLLTPEFWVLFVSFLCGVGTGMAVQNNMGQMGLALGYQDVSSFVSLISIFGFFGRIGSGTISEYFLEKTATPRPLWNATSQLLMAAGYVVMAIALPGSLYIGSIIVGLCYGVRLAITVPTASELFGLKYYGLIYNILILNLPLGSFLFSGLLAGILYDAQATKTPDGGNYCEGAHCYRLVFLVMAMVSVVGFGLDVLLVFKTKPLYEKIAAAKRSRKTSRLR